ncbi:MAG: rod shape-determining protein RodA [Hyphomicrobium sp.]|nr:rod shape-determining protein RodA [Hyphomicrobium sp.]
MTELARRRDETLAERLIHMNWLVLVSVSLLVAIGTATLYSVEGGSFEPWAERHGVRFLLGFGVILAMVAMPMWLWRAAALPIYLLALGLLLLVPVLGVEALGAKRWLDVFGLQFQPTEVMKVAIVLMLARYYDALPPSRIADPVAVFVPVVIIAVPLAFTLSQPDLGSAALYAAVGLGLMFLAGVPILYFAGGAMVAAFAIPFVWAGLHDYQRRRIETFLDPGADPLGAGYHIAQSKIALGAGGISGKGFMQGTQSQLDFLPEKHTDFIFTTFAEEWGFWGALGLLVLYAILLTLLAIMAMRARSMFARLVIAGAWSTIFVYVFINIAMVSGLVPVVGVPLPFVSYGGTSMVTLLAALGLALAADVDEGQNRRMLRRASRP